MVLGKLTIYLQKNKIGFLPKTDTKMNSKWIKDLNVRPQTKQKLHNIGFGNDFLDMIPKAQVTMTSTNRQTGLCENYSFVHQKGFAGGTSGKEPTCQCRRHKRSGLERYPGGGHGNPFQYSCLENPMDRGAWWTTVHGVAKSWTQMSNLACKHMHQKTVHRIKRPPTEYERISAIIYIIRD